MIKIYNARDTFEAQRLCDMLKDEGIESYSQESGSGEYLKITSVYNIYGTDIFVDEEFQDRAKEIIAEYLEECKEVEAQEAQESKTSDIKIPWYKNKIVIARIILAYAIVMGIIMFFVSL